MAGIGKHGSRAVSSVARSSIALAVLALGCSRSSAVIPDLSAAPQTAAEAEAALALLRANEPESFKMVHQVAARYQDQTYLMNGYLLGRKDGSFRVSAAAALSWSVAEWIKNGRASALGAISGAVAGLVAITPAAGFVAPMPALIIGLVAGACCYWMVTRVKAIFGYDDALDAFGVHGAGGTIGALLTGVFATQVINPIFGAGKAVGGSDGHWGQVGNQLVGVLIAWGFALVGTLVILRVVDLITGLRVTEDQEIEGLDITQHGEEAYNLEA